jgi:hypothetical protein
VPSEDERTKFLGERAELHLSEEGKAGHASPPKYRQLEQAKLQIVQIGQEDDGPLGAIGHRATAEKELPRVALGYRQMLFTLVTEERFAQPLLLSPVAFLRQERKHLQAMLFVIERLVDELRNDV